MSVERRYPMATFDTLINRNKDFAAHQFVTSSSLKPTLKETLHAAKALIIACADPRDDPAYVLGFEPGEAVVLRNIGGRITPGTLQMMALLGRIGQVAGENAGGGEEFHLIVLHHTDCGIKRLAGNPEMLADYFGIDQQGLPAKAVADPRAAVAVDVAALKANPALPGGWLVSGLVLDVTTGLVETVVPPSPLRATSGIR
jgi:carbonic anhydrase